MMRTAYFTLAILGCAIASAEAANLSKTYSYFSIGGSTLDEIETELSKRGPQIQGAGRRHPGATQMAFTTTLGYSEKKGSCTIVQANVTVKAKLILPKWRRSKRAGEDVRLIWDTLSSDIKRHEESHVVIAKNHARDLEVALKAIGRQPNCSVAATKAKAVTARILGRHDKKQEEFDKVEGMNFESRIMRLLHYRLQRIEEGKLPG